MHMLGTVTALRAWPDTLTVLAARIGLLGIRNFIPIDMNRKREGADCSACSCGDERYR